mmetsp:Transcript_10680/g.15064  ORF Transcript_10680/g.15064 Transcript_10680/m.15064 type:complete len:304 (+) Transcript_10680:40-951(+)
MKDNMQINLTSISIVVLTLAVLRKHEINAFAPGHLLNAKTTNRGFATTRNTPFVTGTDLAAIMPNGEISFGNALEAAPVATRMHHRRGPPETKGKAVNKQQHSKPQQVQNSKIDYKKKQSIPPRAKAGTNKRPVTNFSDVLEAAPVSTRMFHHDSNRPQGPNNNNNNVNNFSDALEATPVSTRMFHQNSRAQKPNTISNAANNFSDALEAAPTSVRMFHHNNRGKEEALYLRSGGSSVNNFSDVLQAVPTGVRMFHHTGPRWRKNMGGVPQPVPETSAPESISKEEVFEDSPEPEQSYEETKM